MSEFTNTSPPIEFRRVSTGLTRVRFDLYPVKGQNTESEVRLAIAWLRKEAGMRTSQVRWKLPEDNKPLPDQIPIEAIITELKIEIGSLKAYTAELEDIIKTMKRDCNNKQQTEDKRLRKELLKEELVAHWKQVADKRQAEATKLRKDISDLVTRLHNQGKGSSGNEVVTSIK